MSAVDTFRAAVEARDLPALEPLFAADARFYSPMKFTPFAGRAVIRTVFGVLLTQVFEDFRYTGELIGSAETAAGVDAESHLLVFRAAVGDLQIQGIDLIQLDEQGLIQEFTVMIRPGSALGAVSDKVVAGLVAEGVLPASAGAR
ncbi:nuclear transport factor 2 family protein [Nocardia sp. bgisy118]|uniref:nuclear transport factor 2 family protein n=1 Tax=Nocardia sp. bgisy118 TaxID=3413786 RepID=UPI003F4A1E13